MSDRRVSGQADGVGWLPMVAPYSIVCVDRFYRGIEGVFEGDD